ncbi:hypothetical protein E4U42_007395 [Claviceps africana]|uniref:non-specific serine/threonine protein kinase n=1 Tax=Claviceps africana TaxID=83212 RepID=A0A8K0J1Z1_9HYPO|nr:hypothetical protein E4U42_007395 [Claviceps africana]
MTRTKSTIKYGKRSTRTKAERMFAELPQSPLRKPPVATVDHSVDGITEKLSEVQIQQEAEPLRRSPRKSTKCIHLPQEPSDASDASEEGENGAGPRHESWSCRISASLRVLSWDDVCPPGDQIEKIAEASYAEVYRVTNERGTSVIKVIRLPSPIKPQTKAQVRSKLVDEEPHSEADIYGELQISEWLADVPGFVVYKERYLVQGKTSRALLETHQVFQRRMKRKDPGRAQFYPSPSRYLDDTKFLVVELGDAGVALEDWHLKSESQLWDIFFLEAIALARAEEVAMFEHRDLHEGNICIRQVKPPCKRKKTASEGHVGYSGLDITILDYGLSRAEDLSVDFAKPIAYDLERDLSLFTSTHAPQCKVYRQMRSFLLRADRKCLAPEAHKTPYAKGVHGPICWEAYVPYTNVLWLAYLYGYLLDHFEGDAEDLARFEACTEDMWTYLRPDADDSIPCFGSAGDIVCFAVEAGWLSEEQLMGSINSMVDREDSIIVSRDDGCTDTSRRASHGQDYQV